MVPSWLVSMVVHALALIILALIVFPEKNAFQAALTAFEVSDQQVEELDDIEIEDPQPTEQIEITEAVEPTPEAEMESEQVEIQANLEDESVAEFDAKLSDFGTIEIFADNLTDRLGAASEGTGLGGRSNAAARRQMLIAHGGGADTERAVAMALEWLARHQLPNGAWSFDHSLAAGPRARNVGNLRNAYNGATGLALMAFLGAGHTHKQGKYKKVVLRGLRFLMSRINPRTGSLHEPGGNMYSHGICAIALCEAYAMTRDKTLRPFAQATINFIAYAQDPNGGGWRYNPRQPGDTSVVGWQLMALKSGHMAYLAIPPRTVQGAKFFLDSVQTGSGAFYGYTGPGRGPATTAVGLLCRMYMGWKHDEPALQRGVEFLLQQQERQRNNPYFYYYAAQVLHHYGGDHWQRWNSKMRPWLVKTQVQNGPEKGSWYFPGGHAVQAGGRHYCTAMSCMTLEVYYRYSPIYKKQSVEDDFEE